MTRKTSLALALAALAVGLVAGSLISSSSARKAHYPYLNPRMNKRSHITFAEERAMKFVGHNSLRCIFGNSEDNSFTITVNSMQVDLGKESVELRIKLIGSVLGGHSTEWLKYAVPYPEKRYKVYGELCEQMAKSLAEALECPIDCIQVRWSLRSPIEPHNSGTWHNGKLTVDDPQPPTPASSSPSTP